MNAPLLEMKIKENKLTNEKVAALLDIDPATFHRKKKGESDFLRKEIQKIRALLHLSSDDVDAIFFND